MNFSLHHDYLHFFNLQFISLSLIIFIFSLVDLHSIQFLKMKKMLDLIIFIPSIVDMISKNRYVMVKELIMNVDAMSWLKRLIDAGSAGIHPQQRNSSAAW